MNEWVEKTEYPCGCYSISNIETGKRIGNYMCTSHLGLVPKTTEFRPITTKVELL